MKTNKNKPKALFFTLNDIFFGKGGEHLRTRSALQILSNFSSIVLITDSYKAEIDIDLVDDYESKIKKIPIQKIKPSRKKTQSSSFKKIIYKILTILKVAWCFDEINRLFFSIPHKDRIFSELSKQSFDIAWLDKDGFLGTYIPFLKKNGLKVFYNTHNIQSELSYKMKQFSGMNYCRNKIIYFLEKKHEKHFFRMADMLFYCNKNEKAYYRRIMGDNKVSLLPNVSVYEGIHEKPASLPDKYVIWAGSLSVNFHRESLLFLLKDVWPKISEKFRDLHFVIAGRVRKQSAQLLHNECKSLKRVIIIENPERIEGYIQNAVASLSFHKFGSGTRIKILDAMNLGTPVIANSEEIKNFGYLNEKDVLIANTAEEFVQKVEMLLKDDKLRASISTKGKALIQRQYTNKALLPGIKKEIGKMINGK